MYKFLKNSRSLATGKTYTIGQIVPADYKVTQEHLDQNVVAKVTLEEKTMPVYEDMTNEELREALKVKGLPVYGAKAELIERLKGGE